MKKKTARIIFACILLITILIPGVFMIIFGDKIVAQNEAIGVAFNYYFAIAIILNTSISIIIGQIYKHKKS